MALLNFCGFELGASYELAGAGSSITFPTTGAVRSGNRCLEIDRPMGSGVSYIAQIGGISSAGATSNVALGRTAETFYRFAVYITTLPSSNGDLCRVEGAPAVVSVQIQPDGDIYLVGTSTSSLVATLSTGQWYIFELRVTSNGTSGLKIDGGTEQTVTANNVTQNYLRLGEAAANDNPMSVRFDDISIDDAAFNEGICLISVPIGAGSVSDFTGTYADVDELPADDDTTYLQKNDGTDGTHLLDMQTLSTIGASGGTIKSVKSYMRATSSTWSYHVYYLRLKSSSTNSDTSSITPATSYTSYQKIHNVDPATSAAWTESGFNAIEVGIFADHSFSLTRDKRVTSIAAMVWVLPSTGPTEVSLAGNQPAAAGALTPVVLVELAGSQAAASGTLAYGLFLDGAQPAGSGALTVDEILQHVLLAGSQAEASGALSYPIRLSGNQPAGSGALDIQTLIKYLTGNQPASSGSLLKTLFVLLSGSQPNATGTVDGYLGIKHLSGNQPASAGELLVDLILRHVSLAGNQQAAVGELFRGLFELLQGDQPAATGALTSESVIARSVYGNQPAGSGAINVDEILQHIMLLGNQPSALGALAKQLFIDLTGSQPSASGDLNIAYTKKLISGNQPASSGAVVADEILKHITLSGNQPSASGDITANTARLVTLTGSQPAGTGVLDLDWLKKFLAGNQAAATGELYKAVGVALAGNQPAGSGELSIDEILRHIGLVGNQPAADGDLTSKSYVVLAGDQPTASGGLEFLQTKLHLAGSQPAATGQLTLAEILQHIQLSGNQPAATGSLTVRETFSVISLAGNQPAPYSALAIRVLEYDTTDPIQMPPVVYVEVYRLSPLQYAELVKLGRLHYVETYKTGPLKFGG